MQLRGQVENLRFHLEACRRENDVLRSQLRDAGTRGMLPEQAAALFTLKEVTLNRLMTGGIDTDGLPGDDALRVVLEPRDQKGDVLKAPGTITIELVDLALEPSQRRIGYWTFDLQQSLAHWQGGLFGTGYDFTLPWQRAYPEHKDLNLLARLTTPDGRAFRVTEQIEIRLRPGGVPDRVGTSIVPPSPLPSDSIGRASTLPVDDEPHVTPGPPAVRETPATIPSPPAGDALPVLPLSSGTRHDTSLAPASPASRVGDPPGGNSLDPATKSGVRWRPVLSAPESGPALVSPGEFQ